MAVFEEEGIPSSDIIQMRCKNIFAKNFTSYKAIIHTMMKVIVILVAMMKQQILVVM